MAIKILYAAPRHLLSQARARQAALQGGRRRRRRRRSVGLIEVMKTFIEVMPTGRQDRHILVDNEEPIMAGQPSPRLRLKAVAITSS